MPVNDAGPTVAVVVPLYNESAGALKKNIEPLLCASAAVDEIIIVDASDDDAKHAARELGEHKNITVLTAPRGRATQMNFGAKHATTDWLLFLHADCRLPDDAAAHITKTQRRWGRFDVRIDDRAKIFRCIETLMNWRSALTGIITGDQAMFVARDLFERVGGFAEIALMEDIELSRRLKKQSPPARIRRRVLTSARRWKKNGVARTVLLMWRLRFLYWCGADPEKLNQAYRDVR